MAVGRADVARTARRVGLRIRLCQCGVAVAGSRVLAFEEETSNANLVAGKPATLKLSMTLIITIFLMGFAYAPRPLIGLSEEAAAWSFSPQLKTDSMPLQPDEQEWLTKDGAEAAERVRFSWGDVSGSMILITSKTWRAHHRPERCFEVYGLVLNESSTHLVAQDQPVRYVSLGDPKSSQAATATYWFQSAAQTTDDYATRIWSDLATQRERWVLVSILFDEVYDRDAEDVQALYRSIHETVGQRLN